MTSRRARQAGRIDANERLHARAREQQPEHAADHREQHAFGHELAQQPAAAGAERRAHGKLAMTRLRAREQQVGEVRARDQQHEPDRRLQHPDGAAGAADDFLLHRLHLQDVTRAGVRRCAPRRLPAAARTRGSSRRRARPSSECSAVSSVCACCARHAVLQPADQIEEVAAAILAIRRD